MLETDDSAIYFLYEQTQTLNISNFNFVYSLQLRNWQCCSVSIELGTFGLHITKELRFFLNKKKRKMMVVYALSYIAHFTMISRDSFLLQHFPSPCKTSIWGLVAYFAHCILSLHKFINIHFHWNSPLKQI